ncbi:MAG: hypothetical protein IT385_18860 [Deltaproteobacteria bacterium]|nr:hypothetical protein [Deltaproteobacteria bacterium]
MVLTRSAVLLALALSACPADPAFTSSDEGADTTTETVETAEVDDARDTSDTGEASDTAIAGACEPACPAGFTCESGQCLTCAYACEAVFLSGLCGFDGCGGRCGCTEGGTCEDGECKCPTGGCDPVVTAVRSRHHHVLGFDMRAHPFIVTRGDDSGSILLTRWNGLQWEVDAPLGPWGADRPGAAAAIADTIHVVHPSTSGASLAVRSTSAKREREAVTVEVASAPVCDRPRLVTRPVQGDVLLGCVDPESTVLSFHRLVGGETWTPAYQPGVVVGMFDNTLGEAVVHDASWTIDANGAPLVLAARAGQQDPGPLVLATWAIDRWQEEEIATAVQPNPGGIQTALVRTNTGPWAFYTEKLKEGRIVVQLARRTGIWASRTIVDFEGLELVTTVDAEPTRNDLVHLVTLTGGARYHYARLASGDVLDGVDRELFGLSGFAFAVGPDGFPYIAWTDAAGLTYERADRAD